MDCPRCGDPLKRTLKRVPFRHSFEGLTPYRKTTAKTRVRPVLMCERCGKAYIITSTLMETEILGNP